MKTMNIKRVVWVLIFLSFLAGLITTLSAETTLFDNPDNIFIMSSMTTADGTEAITEQRSESISNCKYEWSCTEWSECLSFGKQTRDCTNVGNCPDAYGTPKTEQKCTYTPKTSEGAGKGTGEIGKNKVFLYLIPAVIILLVVVYSGVRLKKAIEKRRGY